MSVESATYINQLDKLHPQGSETISEGDDHICLVKACLVQSLPNIGGAVTATHTDLNTVPNLAPKASPTFTGSVTIPTPAAADNSTLAANTAWVTQAITTAGQVVGLTSTTASASKVPLADSSGKIDINWLHKSVQFVVADYLNTFYGVL